MSIFGHLSIRLPASVFHDIRRVSKIFATWSLSIGFLVVSPYTQGSEASENWLKSVQTQIAALVDANDQAGARRLAESAMATVTKKFETDGEEVAVATALLAQVLYRLEKQEQAITILGRVLSAKAAKDWVVTVQRQIAARIEVNDQPGALRIAESAVTTATKEFGQDSEEEVVTSVLLAQALKGLGKHEQAIKILDRVLIVTESRLGADHFAIGLALWELAVNRAGMGQDPVALQLLMRCIAILEKTVGSEDPVTLSVLNDLGSIYRRLGQLQQALSVLTRSLESIEKAKGSTHPATASTRIRLASVYLYLGDYNRALSLQLSGLATVEKVQGPEHPDTVSALSNLSVTYGALAQYDKALPVQLRVLAIREKVLDPEDTEIATALHLIAMTYVALAHYEKAMPLQIRSLAIREKVQGPEHPDTAIALNNLAWTHGALAQYEKASSLQIRSLAVMEKVKGPVHPDTATALMTLAVTYQALAQHDKALPLLLRSLAIREKVQGLEHPDTALSLNNLASSYRALARQDKALPLQLRALAITEKVLGLEHPYTAMTLNNTAQTYDALAQRDKALPLLLRSLAIREKVQGPEHPDTAMALHNIAMTHIALAQYEKALPLQLRSLAIREKVQGPEHPDTAMALSSLALTHRILAQYEKALPPQLRSLAIQEKVKGPEHPDTAMALIQLASTYGALAQRDKALPLQLRALSIMEKVQGPEHPDTATALMALAITYKALAQHDKALPLELRALSIMEKVQGPEHPDTAATLNQLALTYSALAQHDKAMPLQLRSLQIWEKLLGPEHPATAAALNNLALTYSAKSHHDKALPLQLRSLAIQERVNGLEHPDTALALSNLALIYLGTSHPELAVALFKAAVNVYQSIRERVSEIGSSELHSYTNSVTSTYQKLASVLTDQGRLAEAQQVLDMLKEDEQFDFIRRAAAADPRKTKIGYTSSEQFWLGRYRQIADQLGRLGAEQRELEKQAKLGLTPVQKSRQQALAADLKVAQEAFEAFLGQMREGFAQAGQARKIEVEEVSAQAMRETQSLLKGLGDDAALLQYYITDKRVGMLLTTPGIQLARSSDIDAKDLNRKIGEWRRLLQDPKSNPQPAAQALYEILVAPVAKDLDDLGARNIMLSLDGALRYLPFGALHDGKQYLAQRWNLPIYTSVTKNRLRDTVAPQWQAAGLGVTREWPEFKPLAGVRAEMSAIVKTATGGLMPGEVYLDDAFNALRLRDVSQRQFPVLHVASHFRFSPGTEANSFLLLGDGARLTLGDIRTQNYRFDNVDLLTLSACDTGLGGGRDEQGREIEGFGVIAQQQGAKAVLATLWPVADQSTATLMADMYRRRQGLSLSKIEALRQAQLALQAQPKYAHPYYWAPFILMGNWK